MEQTLEHYELVILVIDYFNLLFAFGYFLDILQQTCYIYKTGRRGISMRKCGLIIIEKDLNRE